MAVRRPRARVLCARLIRGHLLSSVLKIALDSRARRLLAQLLCTMIAVGVHMLLHIIRQPRRLLDRRSRVHVRNHLLLCAPAVISILLRLPLVVAFARSVFHSVIMVAPALHMLLHFLQQPDRVLSRRFCVQVRTRCLLHAHAVLYHLVRLPMLVAFARGVCNSLLHHNRLLCKQWSVPPSATHRTAACMIPHTPPFQAGRVLNTTEYTEYLKGSVYSDLNTLIALVFKSEYFCVTSIQDIQGIHEYFYRFREGRFTGPSKREFTTEFRSEYNRVSFRLPTTRGVDRRSAIWGSPYRIVVDGPPRAPTPAAGHTPPPHTVAGAPTTNEPRGRVRPAGSHGAGTRGRHGAGTRGRHGAGTRGRHGAGTRGSPV